MNMQQKEVEFQIVIQSSQKLTTGKSHKIIATQNYNFELCKCDVMKSSALLRGY